MISVDEASERLLSLVAPLETEDLPIERAHGRALAADVVARHAQPPFAASAMDGYAVAAAAPQPGDRFAVIGEAAAGHPFGGDLRAGAAVRIFTGAPVPRGAARILLQEDVERTGERIRLREAAGDATHIRPAGGDFDAGARVTAPRRLGSRDIALIAAMGHRQITAVRRPVVAILMTGDELGAPGSVLRPGQITASNGYGIAAMAEAEGATARLMPIARDRAESLRLGFDLARGADLLVTIGGASVGDHDLVADAAAAAGMTPAFHKVAMRPGKPLLAGRLGRTTVVGLPGNPVSAMVCGTIFMLPMLRAMQGLPPAIPSETLPLAAPLPANGARMHFMRGQRVPGGCRGANRQDSSLLSVLAAADILIRRPPGDPPRAIGEMVTAIPLPL